MGILDPIESEIKMQCDAMEEALHLFGQEVTIWLPEQIDMYGNIKSEERGIVTNVMISENPNSRTLYNLGWMSEFDGEENTLVYLPCTLNGVQIPIKDGSVVEFRDRMMLRVNSINTKYMLGVFYVLNCNPVVQENANIGKKHVHGARTSFLKADQNEV